MKAALIGVAVAIGFCALALICAAMLDLTISIEGKYFILAMALTLGISTAGATAAT